MVFDTEPGRSDSLIQYKEKGNVAYNEGKWNDAVSSYTEGLKHALDPKEKLVFFKNRAAANLKLGDADKVVQDCSSALEILSNDPKALFRRAQAYNLLGNYELAYQDARLAQTNDSKNREIHSLLSQLHIAVQDKVEQKMRTSGKVGQIMDVLFDDTIEKSKRETAANNLVVLVKERAGCDLLLSEGLLNRLVQLQKTENSSSIRISCTRALSEISKNMSKAKLVLQECGLSFLIDLMNSTDEAQVGATQNMFETLLSSLSGSDFKAGKAPDNILLEENKIEIDMIMTSLTASSTTRTMSAICREAVLELLCRHIGYKELNWGDKFLKIGGLQRLLDIASELKEYHFESAIDITDNTRMITAICLNKVFETQSDDKARQRFIDSIDEYFKEKLISCDVESKVRVTAAITTLLLGPADVGNTFVGREGILEMMLVMAHSGEELQQKVACEALVAASSRKDKCKAIISQGTNILKELYGSKSEAIKVRALVGLCKLGSLGGTDASMRPFADGASLKLADACRRFLISQTQEKEMKRWACEGLSYLTLDAEVKEKLIEDPVALKAIIELAKTGDLNCVYGVVSTLVNLCNAYDKQEMVPEMLELAKFAKQHIPEQHDLDDKDFVDKRVNILTEEGVVPALVALSKTESSNSKELIARIFNAICEQQQNRGKVVQEGGSKALLSLALDGTAKGMKGAAQALARIAITIDPEVAFPGQRAYEVIRPLLKLLDIEGCALENFEALMGLCNLAGVSESIRQRILKEKGLPLIEHYMFEDHEMLRRAAFQCMSNMCASQDVVTILEGENDKIKYLFLCCSDEDPDIVKAASGGLCMVLPLSSKCCHKVFEAKEWDDTLKFLLSSGDRDIQYRGVVIVNSLIQCSKDLAQKIFDTHCKDALMAISKIDHPELVLPKSRQTAAEILKTWCHLKLLDSVDGNYD